MTNWCCLCNSDPCDCKARVQRKKDAALAVEQMCREDGERELTALRAENDRLTERADFLARMNGEKQRLLDTIDSLCEAIHGRLITDDYQDKATTINAMAQMIERLTRELDEARQHLQNVQLLSHVKGVCEGFEIAAPDALKQSETELASVEAERNQLREQLEAARKDSEIIDWLECKGLSTIHTGVTPEIGVHCWEDRDNNCRKWTAWHISSEFTSLRSAARAAIDREATDEAV